METIPFTPNAPIPRTVLFLFKLSLGLAFLLQSVIGTTASAQSCTITIQSVEEILSSGSILSYVKVKGTATNCDSVRITVFCDTTYSRTARVVASNWEHTFKGICACGQQYRVVVECLTNQCPPATKSGVFCSASQTCSIDLQLTGGNCAPDGTILYNYNLVVSGAINTGATASIHLGNGTTIPINLAPGTTTYTGNFFYGCADYGTQPNVYAVLVGCTGAPYTQIQSAPISLALPNCSCPLVGDIVVESIDNCRKRFTVPISPCRSSESMLVWDFGDGHVNDQNLAIVEHTFNNGQYQVRVYIPGNATNCTKSTQVNISGNCTGDEPPPNGSKPGNGKDCGFLGLGCISFNLCWILAMILAVLIIARLVLVAYGWGTTINVADLFSATITAADIAHALVGAFALIVFALCPCEAATMTILAAIIAVIIILVIMYYSGSAAVPNWLMAILIAVALIIASVVVAQLKDCW